MNLNRVFLAGNLTRDPQLKFLSGDKAVCNLSIAVNRKWKDQSGERKEDVCFIDLEAFGRTGETIAQHLTKGRPIFVEGRLKLDSWEDKDGKKQSKLRVVVEQFQFIDSRQSGEAAEAPTRTDRPAAPRRPEPASKPFDDEPPF